ncbi:MAG: helix-turn-helix transcriptional regulator, partial [Chloroflexi bacterium]|nr:helix-turn-helix transcriptional regulator [Chloroflexota bacterium]
MLREQRLLSQQELSAMAGVSKTTVVNVGRATTRPHPGTLQKLAEALGVEPGALAEHLQRPAPRRRQSWRGRADCPTGSRRLRPTYIYRQPVLGLYHPARSIMPSTRSSS